MTQPELKPCPFCGIQPQFVNPNGSTVFCKTHHWGATLVKFWNEAFCWKEIEKLNAEIKALKQDNLGCKEIREQMDGLNEACDSFIARADAYREVAILDAGLILKLKNQPINEVLATRFVDEKADKILAKRKP